jgi:signal transduction histidine kinase
MWVFLLILIVVFTIETGVMYSLPSLLPADCGPEIATLLDGFLLTAVLAPVLWFLIVAPLRRLAAGRTEMLQLILTAQEEERRRISRDLHDEIGQSLTSLMVGLRTLQESPNIDMALQRADELRRLGKQIHDELRRLARGLRPSILDDLGLAEALKRYAEEYEQTHGIAVRVLVPEPGVARLSEAIETALYRIALEALTNVVKHARATRVILDLSWARHRVRMRVTDNGRGFPPGFDLGADSPHGHLGLPSMAERAALLGGRMLVESRAGGGTTLSFEIPLRKDFHVKDPHLARG